MTIMDLLCYDLKELHITGFTWFRDGWRKSYKKLSDDKFQKVSDEVKSEFNGNHKQKPQEDLVKEIYLKDSRVSIDNIMKEILEVE